MSGDSTRRKMDVEGLRLELPDGGNGNACWSTPKMFVPKSPYNLDGLLADSAKRTVFSPGDDDQTVQALLDFGMEIPRVINVQMPGTPRAVRVTVTRGGARRGRQRRPEVNTQGVALVKRWNRRRSLAPREDGEFTLLDDLRRQFMANEDDTGDNWELYSDKALLMRESLKYHPRVRAVLWDIWLLYDADGDGTIDHEEYVHTNKLVQRCLLDDFDASSAEETAETDWEVDSAGHDHLDYARFTQSWFQLADLWTEGISADQYASFLENVIECIAKVGPDGKLRLRNDNEIRTLTTLAREAQDGTAAAAAEREAEREAAANRAAVKEQARRIRDHWDKPPKGFIPAYIPQYSEQRKAMRVDSSHSRRREVRLNVPITSTWLLDGMEGVRPADSSKLWHVQGVSQPTHEPPRRSAARVPADAEGLQARVRGERERKQQLISLTAGRAVAEAKVDGKLSDDGSSVSNPGESAPTSPELHLERSVTTAASMLRRPYSSGRTSGKTKSHSLAYSNVYVSLATAMNIADREQHSSVAKAQTNLGPSRLKAEPAVPAHGTADGLNAITASRPNTAPSARSRAAARRSTAPSARSLQPVPPAAAGRPVATLQVPSSSRAEPGAQPGISEAKESTAADVVVLADQSGESDRGVTVSERPTAGAGNASSSPCDRPSTAPRRIEGSALRERAARKSDRVASSSSRPQTAPASSSKSAQFISVPGGKPVNSVLTAHVNDSATPLSPTTRQRRLQAAASHYFVDTMGNVRHLALDRSSKTGAERTGGGRNKGSYRALRMQARSVSARPPAGRAKPPTTRVSSARQRRSMHQHVAARTTAASPVAVPVKWIVGAPPPVWSRQQQGWSCQRT